MNNHIQNIEIFNFKSIKDLKIKGCKKINIFAGKPNAGKSNILEALGLFGSLNERIDPILRFNRNEELFFEGNNFDGISVKIDDDKLMIIDKNYKTSHSFFSSFNESPNEMGFNDGLWYGFKSSSEFGIKIFLDRIRKILYLNYNKEFELKESFKQIDKKYSSEFQNIGYLASRDSKIRTALKKIFDSLNLKFLIEKNTEEIKIFKEYQDGTVFILPYNMLADTIQRLIFYKVSIMGHNNSVLLFEEPEAHCFEPYILEFTNEVKYNENNNQFFIVTHSDFIIQEFLRDEESRNDAQIYLVNNVDGKTEVKKLDAEKNEDVYEYNMNVFFNFDNLWETN